MMFEVSERPDFVERAFLVGAYQDPAEAETADDLLSELGDLAASLGITVVGRERVRIRSQSANLLVGTGKADEIVAMVAATEADCIIFDNELSPVQQRNWEKLSKVCVIDRQEVIIDIFARRAQTKEAKLQVELARAEFCLPRLKRAWTHLGRQGGSGGIGDRGEGEMQIEVDRRILRRNVDHLKAELAQVRKHRATQRKHRERVPLPLASIVGYTNAGKSSLLRLLTGADVLVADKLFATLDTTTRRLQLENGQTLLLTDTVGFIRHLPHRLVEAFKSTLEEAVLADFLVHVLDVNHPNVDIFHQTTLDVLRELGADEKRMLTVFNKMDLVQDPARIADLQARYPQAIFVSVKTGAGRDQLLARMAGMLGAETRQMTLWVPHQRADVIASLHSLGRVLSCTYEDDHVHVVAFVPKRVERQFEPFTQAPADLSS